MLGGGLSAWARGGPRSEHDVDFLVRPDDVDTALAAFDAEGWETQRPPEGWLVKTWHPNGALVDLIYNPASGPITDEQIERAPLAEVMAVRVHVSTLEDVMVAKLMAMTEQEPDFGACSSGRAPCASRSTGTRCGARTEASPFARAFFTLVEGLGVVERRAAPARARRARTPPVDLPRRGRMLCVIRDRRGAAAGRAAAPSLAGCLRSRSGRCSSCWWRSAGSTFAFAGRYGWQRDELYYAVAGRHLQGGYVEFPPVTALLSAAARVLFGWSLVGFRAFPILAGAATILLAALVARELGGDRRAQTLAAALVAFSPILLATNGLFQPVSFDQTATMLVLWLALRLALGRGSWLALGVAVGVGLETKYTLAVVLVLLIAGFALWRRYVLASRGFALAIAIAGVLMVPNLLWEAGHGWISVHWFLHPPGERHRRVAPAVPRRLPAADEPVRRSGGRRRSRHARARPQAAADRGRRRRRPGRLLRARRQVVLRDAGRVLRARGGCGADSRAG